MITLDTGIYAKLSRYLFSSSNIAHIPKYNAKQHTYVKVLIVLQKKLSR